MAVEVWQSNQARASSKIGITAPMSICSWMFSKSSPRLSKKMIIKTRSIFDCEVSTLVDFDKIDASSSLRASDIEEPKTGEEDKFSEEPKHDQHFWRVYSRRRRGEVPTGR